MSLSFVLGLRQQRLQDIIDRIDVTEASGSFLLYAGTKPAPGGTPTGDLQTEIILALPCAVVAEDDSILTFVTPREGVRIDTQTITWGRIVDGDGNYVIDGTVTNEAGSGDFKIDNVDGLLGAVIRFDGGTFGE